MGPLWHRTLMGGRATTRSDDMGAAHCARGSPPPNGRAACRRHNPSSGTAAPDLPYRAQRDDLQHTHIRTSRSPTPSGGTRCRGLWRGASGAWNVPPAIVGRAPSIWAARTAKRCDEGTIWEGDHTRSLDSRMRPPPVPQHRESTKGCKLFYGGARVAKHNLPMQHHDVAMAHGATRPSP